MTLIIIAFLIMFVNLTITSAILYNLSKRLSK